MKYEKQQGNAPAMSHTTQTLHNKLKQVFGYDEFRPLQLDVIQNLLNGKDSLAIMPTGSGKSLCFQLPALLFDGLTIVVSPLISLMEDQVMQLQQLGIAAATLNSTLFQADYQAVINQLRSGQIALLYAAPETLLQPHILQLLGDLNVSCLTIDEAHCISAWGHDFRPEYRQLIDVRERLPNAVCLAVTATATEQVRDDIKETLGIAAAHEFIASFDRPNLFLSVAPKTDTLAQTLAFLADHQDESGIIYCATRKGVDDLTEKLQQHGWNALPYHAGLDNGTRQRNQHQFSRDDVPIIVATIAFGMGINKSNVRFVMHVDLPKNLESYYQQIGRAGRDGLRADCLLLYSYGDVNTINYFLSQQADDQQRIGRIKLEAMLGFAEGSGCRRVPLLAYFNEAYGKDNCEMCDNCTGAQAELVDVTIPAQKFLSCVKRTGELFGTTHIIDVLRGSQSQKVLSKNHHQLSTYNIGTEFSKKEWQHLARQFLQQGLMVQDVTYGSLKLTEKAYAVFKGEQVMGTLMEPERKKQASAMPKYDQDLFQQLRAKRKALADAANVPPFVIFSDRTLAELASYFPQSKQRFATMYGVGASKLEQYAGDFLPIIQAYCEANSITEQRKAVTSGGTARSGRGRREEIVELWNEGSTLSDLMAQFSVKDKTIVKHLWDAVREGTQLRPQSLRDHMTISDEQEAQLDQAFNEHGAEFLRPVFDALNGTVSYDVLHIYRLHYMLKP